MWIPAETLIRLRKERVVAALQGIRVVECGVAVAGPLTCRYLGHMGADVLKIETRAGQAIMGAGPAWAPPGVGAAAPDLLGGGNLFNAQKRSIAIDLKHPEGKRVFHELIAASDIFICNLSGPAIESLGLTYPELSAVNPRLIHLTMPGFGARGPYRDYRSWGPNLSSLAGYDDLTGDPDRSPVMTPVPLPDYLSAYHAIVAVLGALRERARTGAGVRIDLAQYTATVAGLGPQIGEASLGKGSVTRRGNRQSDAAPVGVFPARGDDRWVAIGIHSDREWAVFRRVTGLHALDDSRFATVEGRLQHQDEIESLIAAWTAGRTPVEVALPLQAAGVTAAPVQDQWDHVADPQLQANEFWKVVNHAWLGIDVIPSAPIRAEGSPLVYETAVAPFGWHNVEALREVLGYSAEKTAALEAEGALQAPSQLGDPATKLDGRPWFRWGLPMLRLSSQPPAVDRQPLPQAHAASAPEGAPGGRPLSGVRVLDFSTELSAYGTRLLTLLGADVTRVDSPAGATLRAAAPVVNGTSLYAAYMDAGKTTITLSLDDEAGRARFHDLVAGADVVYEGFAPGYLAERGIDVNAALAANPRLSWVSVTPFGHTGPYRDWAADDLILWALSGMVQYTGYPDRRPLAPGGNMSFTATGAHGAMAALIALEARERTGRGQYVEVSGHEVMVATAQGGTGMLGQMDDMITRKRKGDRSLASVPYGFYAAEDGLVSILALFPAHWDSLAEWIKEVTGDERVLDEKYRGAGGKRVEFSPELTAYVTSLTSRYTMRDFCPEAQRRGIPAAQVNSLPLALTDPHLGAIGYWQQQQVPGVGTVTWPGAPFVLDAK